ncbi:MAG TPA: hypothetical protein PJ992_13590, partial [Arachnia sp.]|nr:hypothetical protein [Arachnia sp.]
LEAVLADGGQWSRPWSAKQREDVVGVGNLLYAMLVARWPGPGNFGLPPAPLAAGEPAPPHEVLVGVSFALDRICTTTLTDRGAAGEPRITTTSQLVSMLTQVLGTANASADLEARVRAWTDDDAPARWVPAVAQSAEPEDSSAERMPAVPAKASPASAPSGPATPTSPLGPISAGTGVDKHRRALWAIVILAVAALVVSLIVVGAMNAKDNAAAGPASAPPAVAGSGSPAADPGAEAPITIVGATDFDPETDGGNAEENPDAVAKAFDGDPATYWETLRYKNRPNLGGLKPGVGIVLDLGEKRTVTAVELILSADDPTDPTSVEIRVPEGSKPSTRTEADWTVVGADDAARGTVTIELDTPTETQHLLVYFTKLPPTDGGYKARLHEVTVK